MTLQCQTEDILTKHKVFLLLKEGTLSPTQPKILENDRAEFTLHNVTVSDSGYYSCVYHQAEAPFWASYPSNDLQILVTELWLLDEVEITKPPQIKEGSGSSGIVIVVVSIVIFLLLLSAILIYKYSQRGSAPDNRFKSCCFSKDPEEVVTGASTDGKSCTPTLNEGPQTSGTENAHRMTYSELNARAIEKGEASPSQSTQLQDSCVYSEVKKKQKS
ncbi:V-set and transmembrane domain-containing protein 1-like isoform X2 [Castor canadensis]|uniref:V-set and transmembrane domain-containing protein 1-like isoform X2 n=1 Tax=Castor canadensis TaxID=51338 RepID=A0AC59BXP4_CASCN